MHITVLFKIQNWYSTLTSKSNLSTLNTHHTSFEDNEIAHTEWKIMWTSIFPYGTLRQGEEKKECKTLMGKWSPTIFKLLIIYQRPEQDCERPLLLRPHTNVLIAVKQQCTNMTDCSQLSKKYDTWDLRSERICGIYINWEISRFYLKNWIFSNLWLPEWSLKINFFQAP